MTIEHHAIALSEMDQTINELTYSVHRLAHVLGINLPEQTPHVDLAQHLPETSSVMHEAALRTQILTERLNGTSALVVQMTEVLLDGDNGSTSVGSAPGLRHAPELGGFSDKAIFASRRAHPAQGDVDGPL